MREVNGQGGPLQRMENSLKEILDMLKVPLPTVKPCRCRCMPRAEFKDCILTVVCTGCGEYSLSIDTRVPAGRDPIEYRRQYVDMWWACWNELVSSEPAEQDLNRPPWV